VLDTQLKIHNQVKNKTVNILETLMRVGRAMVLARGPAHSALFFLTVLSPKSGGEKEGRR
jgi:hypothetical protein